MSGEFADEPGGLRQRQGLDLGKVAAVLGGLLPERGDAVGDTARPGVAERATAQQRRLAKLPCGPAPPGVDLGSSLSGLALGAAALATRADVLAPALAAGAWELQADIQAAVEQTREISHGLRPPILDDRGLEAAIRSRVIDRLALDMDVRLQITGALDGLTAAVSLAALRIVQEAAENVRRHARARVCTVDLTRTDGGLRIEVSDDSIGIGIDVDGNVSPGVGLRSIRERASELGGHTRISRNRRPPGTIVTAWLPFPATHRREDAS